MHPAVDTERLQSAVLDADIAHALEHHTTRRQHQVNALVEITKVFACQRTDPGAEPLAQHAREVRVIERHHGNVESACGITRSPARRVRITRFNEIRLESLQRPFPGGTAQRKSIAVSERKGGHLQSVYMGGG